MNKNTVEDMLANCFGPSMCPECKSDARRPKCMFELGGDCPRHEVLDIWQNLNNSARKYVLATENE